MTEAERKYNETLDRFFKCKGDMKEESRGMKIETKYDIGQEVFWMRDNKVVSGKIMSIQVVAHEHGVFIHYLPHEDNLPLQENQVFDSVEMLCEMLCGGFLISKEKMIAIVDRIAE